MKQFFYDQCLKQTSQLAAIGYQTCRRSTVINHGRNAVTICNKASQRAGWVQNGTQVIG